MLDRKYRHVHKYSIAQSELFFSCYILMSLVSGRMGGVMVSLLASNGVNHGFKRMSGQTRDYKIGICCFSAKHTAIEE
jgi:hypothetical protein